MNSSGRQSGMKDYGFYAVVLIILMIAVVLLLNGESKTPPQYSEILRYFQQEKVEKFTVKDSTLLLQLKDGTTIKRELYDVDYFREDTNDIVLKQSEEGTISDYDYDVGFQPPWWLTFVPTLLILGVFIALWYSMFNRNMGGDRTMRFGKARTRQGSEEKKRVTFADVAGADEEKAELQEIVEFLKNPRRFIDIGARIPKGVLLVGPPGTGKTLIAKAVAGEAGVQFLSISGSDFVELYVGVGASRVRDLFEQAKKSAPGIIFIDEIDAVGRHRGAGMGGGHDEREQTLNQLLVEMDGFGNNEGVIVIAATNRQDILDPALLRPGRFDRQVYVGLPDIKGREAILNVHKKGKKLEPDVDMAQIAKTTPGFTGADLENLLNEAALLAARNGSLNIRNQDLRQAMLKVIAGPEKRSKVITEKSRRLTAYHEAGHAVVTKGLTLHDPVTHISIIPRGVTGGVTVYMPDVDKDYRSKTEMFERIVSGLGGRVAEKLVLDDVSTGASNDIQQVTNIARNMVVRYGMSEKLGPIAYSAEHDEVFLGRDYGHTRPYSDGTAKMIDEEVKGIIDSAYEKCKEILTRHKDKLDAVAEYLLAHESMDGPAFEKLFEANN